MIYAPIIIKELIYTIKFKCKRQLKFYILKNINLSSVIYINKLTIVYQF